MSQFWRQEGVDMHGWWSKCKMSSLLPPQMFVKSVNMTLIISAESVAL